MRCCVRWARAVPDHSGFLLGLEALDHQEALVKIHQSIMAPKKVV